MAVSAALGAREAHFSRKGGSHMIPRIALLVCLIVLLAGFARSAKISDSSYSQPPVFTITSPPSDVSPMVAALSGMWVATNAGIGPTHVVVERINETWASMLQYWPAPPPGYTYGGWKRFRARVLPTGELLWGYPAKFKLRIAEDGITLESKIERGGTTTSTMTLKKVESL
jgi:hypothetical protein